MDTYSFAELFQDVTRNGRKIPTDEYREIGRYPVIDQGQHSIAGYFDETDGLFTDIPAIIFGDHTRIVKYCDRPFFLGADGTKLLKKKQGIDANEKYLYYYVKAQRIPDTGYNRHFKWLKETVYQLPERSEQERIVEVLDDIERLLSNRRGILETLDELVKARFVEMFGDPVCNNRGWNKYALKEKCKVITGNTPSRGEAQNYGDKIEWIKSDNIMKDGRLSTATEMLSDRGLTLGRAVEAGSILMTCIAGSLRSIGNVAVTNRKVAFNQQINAIVPGQQNPLFMYVQFLLSKTYLHQSVNMSLKGILSKGALENKKFIFPPVVIQNQFAAFVREVDQTKAAVRAQVAAMETLRAKMMQDFFG